MVPRDVRLSRTPIANFERSEGRYLPTVRSVVIEFANETDWLQCFLLGNKARLPKEIEDELEVRAWAGVAMCGELGGLAIFAFEEEDASYIEARIQPVPQDKFEALLRVDN